MSVRVGKWKVVQGEVDIGRLGRLVVKLGCVGSELRVYWYIFKTSVGIKVIGSYHGLAFTTLSCMFKLPVSPLPASLESGILHEK